MINHLAFIFISMINDYLEISMISKVMIPAGT